MHYVCIEDNVVVSVLNYQPNVPSSVTVVEITDVQHAQIIAGTHKFDVLSKTVTDQDAEILTAAATQLSNAEDLEFLRSTDWKVLRHLRQKALGISTSLTDAEYLELEQQRNDAASRIV
jgi:hypothetical protein